MANISLFTPIPGGTITVTATSGAAKLTALYSASTAGTGGTQCRIKNPDATAIAFVRFTTSAGTASTTTDIPVGPGDICGFTVDLNATPYLAYISSATSQTLYAT